MRTEGTETFGVEAGTARGTWERAAADRGLSEKVTDLGEAVHILLDVDGRDVVDGLVVGIGEDLLVL